MHKISVKTPNLLSSSMLLSSQKPTLKRDPVQELRYVLYDYEHSNKVQVDGVEILTGKLTDLVERLVKAMKAKG